MKSFPNIGIIEEIIELDSVDSTNRYALEAGRKGLLILARTQTLGRGRRGRAWFSPEGENLYMTVTMAPSEERYPIIAGVAVREALARFVSGVEVAVKWPNDVIIAGKKVSGILCETRGAITAVGIGVNVNKTSWPEDLEHRAVSLMQVSLRRFSIDEVAEAVVVHLGMWVERFLTEGFRPVREEFLHHGLLKGYDVFTEEGQICTIVDLDMEGCLIIDVSGRRKSLRNETISLGWERTT
jgi:BirA family biotin operon repressor/biotin-[acetyl-CoA-carboxylase] ligase